MDFITSDIHFSHKNIMKFCPVSRAFGEDDVDKMDEEIIWRWNSVVQPHDHTYILGDVAFCSAEKAVRYLKRLNGNKTLIRGNHDVKLINDRAFCNEFDAIQDYYSLTIDKTKVIMSHYPFLSWDQMHRGSVMFHGHLHGSKSGMEKYRILDVGMDNYNCYPMQLSTAINMALKGEIKGHH